MTLEPSDVERAIAYAESEVYDRMYLRIGFEPIDANGDAWHLHVESDIDGVFLCRSFATWARAKGALVTLMTGLTLTEAPYGLAEPQR